MSNPQNDRSLKQIATVDWLTCTTTDKETGWSWYKIFTGYQGHWATETGQSPIIRPMTRHGYQGRQGEGMFWGVHDRQGYLLVTWGEASDMVWPMTAPTAKRVSRLDLAVTVELPSRDPDLVAKAYALNEGSERRQYAMIQSSAGGKTLYVGSRQSDQYGRLYDKGVKDMGREPGEIWRYEIELKDKIRNLAVLKDMYDRWRLHGLAKEDIAGYVHQWFSVRGVSPKFSARGKGLPPPELEATVSTADKKLRWLSSQVAPTVKQLIDVGLGKEAILALGLEADQLPFWDDNVIPGEATGDSDE